MLAPVTEAQFGESALTALLLEGAAPLAGLRRRARGRHRRTPSATTRPARSRWRSMRPTAPASTTSSPTSTRSASTRTAAAPRSAARLVPALSPTLRGGIEVPGRPPGRQPRPARRAGRGLPRGRGRVRRRAAVAAVERRARARPGGRPPPRRRTTSSWRPGPGCAAIGGLEPAPGCPRCARSRATSCASGPAPDAGAPLLARTVRGPRARPLGLPGAAARRLGRGRAPPSRSAATTPRCRPARCTSCSATPGRSCPAVDELELLEAATGLRPATPDNTPRIGWTALDGVAVATGHYRNGDPAGAAHRGRRRRPARHRAGHAARRGAGARHDAPRAHRQRRAARGRRRAAPSPTWWPASPRTPTRRAWPWPSTAASSHARSGPATPARAGSLVEVVSAAAGG